MVQLTQFFQPPLYWQQFEDLTQAVVNIVFKVVHSDKIGRPGQAQNGVDVHVTGSSQGSVGVQCKRLDDLDKYNQPLPGGVITVKIIQEEMRKATKFSPKLDIWILATTAKRDAVIQRYVRKINEEQKINKKFQIQLWFWDDYVTWLNAYTDLQKMYYHDVIKIQDTRDQDRIIIDTIATAFHRPAFTDPLRDEHFDNFLQALKDTQKAMRTGELVDRESRHVIRKSLGGWRLLKERNWKAQLKELDSELSTFRTLLASGIKDGRLMQQRGYLEINDRNIGVNLDAQRQKCLNVLNRLLEDAELPPI